ncbi:GGDEF domain-containing protein [Lutibaculum baratangense]|uniref:diguanylate cyclase n=1 Tax=Lutibaculum baratangense AMV1 TaxID=631454 RepID=V4RAC4_9HYPH|nr:GGDEF domain-containing protein [Lutibaculum baratangense]ESR23126.1 GGDEF family protein [Lutibaculum baratangense AMV1]
MGEGRNPSRAEDESLARVSGLVDFGLELRDENERLRLELEHARARILELEALVERDSLAPVYNRRGLMRELDKAIAHCRRYGEKAVVFYVDLDRFKSINDEHGHGAGDRVIECVGEVLARATRLSDTVARVGGDEFVLILRHITLPTARTKADSLKRIVADLSIAYEGVRLSATASIGVAELSEDDTPQSILTRADAAMYAEKRAP